MRKHFRKYRLRFLLYLRRLKLETPLSLNVIYVFVVILFYFIHKELDEDCVTQNRYQKTKILFKQ